MSRICLSILCGVLLSIHALVVTAEDHTAALIAQGNQAYQQGQWENAVTQWLQALRQSTSVGEQVDLRVRLAAALQAMGRQSKSFVQLDEALKQTETLDDPARRVAVLTQFSDAWLGIGDTEAALNMADAAVVLSKETEAFPPALQAAALNALGNALAVWPNVPQARIAYEEAYALAAQHAQHELAAKAQINLLNMDLAETLWEKAQEGLAQVLETLEKLPVGNSKTTAYLSIGLAARDLSRQPQLPKAQREEARSQAINAFQQAARLAQAGTQGDRSASLAYGYLGQMYENEQRIQEAKVLTNKAIFHARQGQYPEILYRWQWQAGRLHQSEEDTDAAIAAYQAAGETLRPIQQRLDVGYRSAPPSFDDAVRPVYYGLASLLLKQADSEQADTARQALLKQARNTVEQVKVAELQNYFGDECVQDAQAQAAQLDNVDPHTAIIYPIPLQDELVVLLSLGDQLQPFRTAISAAQLRDTVTLFRQRLQTRPTKRFMYEAQTLFDWLIRPLLPTLEKAQIDTLVFVPDGSLRSIPFSTLHDGKQFLIEQFAVATTPGLNLTRATAINWQESEVLLIGLSDGVQGYSPLPNVPKELESIQKITGGNKLLDGDYTLDNFRHELKSKPYAVIHMATHGEFDADPEHTYLLTYQEKVHMDDLQALIGLGKYREQPVELLTLSACKTAVGDDKAALGLAGVAVKAGASSALATLWFVDDEATSLVVTDFYKRLLNTAGLSKAKALQQAQVALLRQVHYQHPAYWGPFLLIGNWL